MVTNNDHPNAWTAALQSGSDSTPALNWPLITAVMLNVSIWAVLAIGIYALV